MTKKIKVTKKDKRAKIKKSQKEIGPLVEKLDSMRQDLATMWLFYSTHISEDF